MKLKYKNAGFILLISLFISVTKCTGNSNFALDSGHYLAHTAIELVLNELPKYDIPQINHLLKIESTAQITKFSTNRQLFHGDIFSYQIEPVKLSVFNKKPILNHLHSRITNTIYCNSSYL